MKIISITSTSSELTLVVDNIAYIQKDDSAYTCVLVDGTSVSLTESEYNEIKSYMTGE